jgi:hypothetical protein
VSPKPTKTNTDRLRDAEEIIRQKNTKLLLAEKQIRQIFKDNDAAEKIRTEIYGLKALTPDPPKWILSPAGHGPTGVPVTIWSDFHWGEKVDPTQVGGVNKFNRSVARGRLQHLVNSTVDLTLHHMVRPNYPGIVVCLGGDMITGTIHEDLARTNDGPVQLSLLEIQEQLTTALRIMADKFGKVFVPCVVGNHGRETIKPRTNDIVYTSYEWNLYCQLELAFRDDPRVQFFIPNETDAYFTVLGHRFLLTHGDRIGAKGGDGIIGAIGPIARGATKVGRAEAQIGRDFDTLIIGHYHTYIPRGDAMPVLANGSLIGYNTYARLMLRVPFSRPTQALAFINKKYGFTAQWAIYLDKMNKSANTADWIRWQKQRGGLR